MGAKTCSCCGFDVDIIHRATKAVRAADTKFEKVGGTSRHWTHECFLPELEREGLRLVDNNLPIYDPATHVVVSRQAAIVAVESVEFMTNLRNGVDHDEEESSAAELRAALEVSK